MLSIGHGTCLDGFLVMLSVNALQIVWGVVLQKRFRMSETEAVSLSCRFGAHARQRRRVLRYFLLTLSGVMRYVTWNVSYRESELNHHVAE